MSMELQKALEEYKKCFGENYALHVGIMKTDTEIIDEIQKCIRTGKKQYAPKYDEGLLY